MLTNKKVLDSLSKNDVALKEVASDLKITKRTLSKFLQDKYSAAKIYVDGGARGNPGEAGAGVVVEYDKKKEGYFFYINKSTNNIAEYQALFKGLKIAVNKKLKNLLVFSDSELICKQITGEYKIRSSNLLELYKKCNLLIGSLNSFEITHIPREKNKEADKLVNIAINSKQNGRIELTLE